ncbi:MAG: hypothetical protein ABIK83_00550 [Candidatus Zixiibacteriota bacterium]
MAQMSYLILVIVCLYALGVTIALIATQRRESRVLKYGSLLDGLDSEQVRPRERLRIISEYAKIRSYFTPWYEKSISTIGVVAFFSMIVGTTIHVIDTAEERVAADRLRFQIEKLEEEKSAAESVLPIVSRTLIDANASGRELSENELSLLRYRARQLSDSENLSPAELVELYNLQLLMREYAKAVKILENNLEVLDQTVPADRVTLAEYYILIGAHTYAGDLLSTMREEFATLPSVWKLRYATLWAIAFGDSARFVAELASDMKISRSDAQERIRKEVGRLTLTKAFIKGDEHR